MRKRPWLSTGRNDMSLARFTAKTSGVLSRVRPSNEGKLTCPSDDVAALSTVRPFFPITSTSASPTGRPEWMDWTKTS